MVEAKRLIVMSGLPASGKTTLGRELAKQMGFQFIDKNDVLESLFSAHTICSTELRQTLIRESDKIFRDRATQSQNAVLTSFWRPSNAHSTAGAPSHWLPTIASDIIEILCHCDIEVAVDRSDPSRD